MDLFATGPQVLVDDEAGRIDYVPGLLDADFAARAFVALRDHAAWRSERRKMYDRVVDVPRLLGSYSLHDPALPAEIAAIHARVIAQVPAPFDSVGLNLYRDENDAVAPHNDHLYEIAEGEPIALVSLGAAREMVIRSRQPPKRVLRIDLAPGSLLVMSYATQLHYDHGIPRQKHPHGARISLAFRARGNRARRY